MSETAARKDIQKLQRAIVDGLEHVKAQDIRVFDTAHLSPLFERVLIASGASNRQTRAIAASVRDKVRTAGLAKPRLEGEDNGEWIIIDCGPAVAHVMQPAIRQYYRLEELWGDKPVRLKIGAPKPKPAIAAKPAAAAKSAAAPSPAKAAAAKKAVARQAPARKAAGKTSTGVGDGAAARTVAPKTTTKTTVKATAKPARKTTARAAAKKAPFRKPIDPIAPARPTTSGARQKTAAKAPPKTAARKTAARPAAQATARSPARKTAVRKTAARA